MANDFVDNETQKFLGKVGIEFCVFGKNAQASNLTLFAAGIGWGQAMVGFVTTDSLRYLKAFGEHEHECSVDIVDAVAEMLQLRVDHPALPVQHLP